jgi:BioD-like phosphotransacetylase family protein
VKALAEKHKARVIAVGTATSPGVDAPKDALVGTIITGVAAADLAAVRQRAGVLAVLTEDRTLAAPSVGDIAAALKARWLVENDAHGSIERVMIGTVSSDAASPYFEARERKCVVTRFDKTDIQLAALQTDMEVLVLTGGGQPSPYLLDRVAGTRDDVSVLLAEEGTVDVMRSIEGLYGGSRFEGQGKLERAVALLDDAGVVVGM